MRRKDWVSVKATVKRWAKTWFVKGRGGKKRARRLIAGWFSRRTRARAPSMRGLAWCTPTVGTLKRVYIATTTYAACSTTCAVDFTSAWDCLPLSRRLTGDLDAPRVLRREIFFFSFLIYSHRSCIPYTDLIILYFKVEQVEIYRN